MSSEPFSPADSMTLVDETALDTGDTHLIMTGKELEGLDNHFLRNLAAEASSDEVHGKSTKLEIVSYLKCQRTLSEYGIE